MQWLGPFNAQTGYQGLLDLDDLGTQFGGYLMLIAPQGPWQIAFFRTPSKDVDQSFELDFQPFFQGQFPPISEQLLREYYPEGYHGRATLRLEFGARKLRLSWRTSTGSGSLSVPNSNASKPSIFKGLRHVRSWDKFKRFCDDLPDQRYIFRGQPKSWRLRTSFHRSGRSDLVRYLLEDLPNVHRALSGRTKHIFNRSVGEENGAFLNLLQHHGYPTPLLDWSESPFVAAYFAYEARREEEDTSPVRILRFDKKQWQEDVRPFQNLTLLAPHLSILEALATENDRALPQQALSTVTNVDDIESYIRVVEGLKGKTYLTAIDLLYNDRSSALRDLAFMGITAGSIYPGLDGACRALKAKHFGYES